MSLTLYGGVRGSPQYLVLIYSGGGPPTPPASMPAVATRAWTTPRSQCSTAAPSCCGGCRTRRPARPPTAPPRAGSSAGDGCTGLAGKGGARARTAERDRGPVSGGRGGGGGKSTRAQCQCVASAQYNGPRGPRSHDARWPSFICADLGMVSLCLFIECDSASAFFTGPTSSTCFKADFPWILHWSSLGRS
jgi:hypothetical protein